MNESAARARCSVRTIQRAIQRGDIDAGGSPGRRLIHRDQVDGWIMSHSNGKPAPERG